VEEAIETAKQRKAKDIVWPESLPPWIQKICAESEEYKSFLLGQDDSEPADLPAEEDLQPSEEVPF
jgi:hypothetical protein